MIRNLLTTVLRKHTRSGEYNTKFSRGHAWRCTRQSEKRLNVRETKTWKRKPNHSPLSCCHYTPEPLTWAPDHRTTPLECYGNVSDCEAGMWVLSLKVPMRELAEVALKTLLLRGPWAAIRVCLFANMHSACLTLFWTFFFNRLGTKLLFKKLCGLRLNPANLQKKKKKNCDEVGEASRGFREKFCLLCERAWS